MYLTKEKPSLLLILQKGFVCKPEIVPKHFDKVKPEPAPARIKTRPDPKSPYNSEPVCTCNTIARHILMQQTQNRGFVTAVELRSWIKKMRSCLVFLVQQHNNKNIPKALETTDRAATKEEDISNSCLADQDHFTIIGIRVEVRPAHANGSCKYRS